MSCVSTKAKILADLEAEAVRLASSSDDVSEWAERCASSLRRLYGERSRELADFTRIGYEGPFSLDGYDDDEGRTREDGLRKARALLGAWRQVELTFPEDAGDQALAVELKEASPKLERFLVDHKDILKLCDSVDIAGVAVENKGRVDIVCVRITAGTAEDTLAQSLVAFGPWRVFRTRCAATHFADIALTLTRTGRLRFDDQIEFVCEALPRDLYSNDFVQTPDAVFTKGQAQITWLGGSCGAKTFSDYAEQSRFSRLIATSDDYHNVPELVRKLSLRQSLSTDEQRGIRLEIEPPLYFRHFEWRPDRAVLHFSVPALVDLTEMRVKWQTQDARGIAPISRDPGGGCTAAVITSGDQLDATVICRTFSLWVLAERRPQRLADFFPEPETEDDTEENLPDYSKFETTRRGLRLSIKKQVSRDEALYKIVARDIEDAIFCLERGKHKLAAILSGAIIEATLLKRLSAESQADLEAAFRAAFPNHAANKPVPPLKDMKLAQLIAVAEKRNKLSDHKIYDGIRDWRNFIHPNVEAKKGSIDVTAAQIAVTAAVRLLLGKS